MPNGQKYDDWLKDREGREEDGETNKARFIGPRTTGGQSTEKPGRSWEGGSLRGRPA